ncbi:ATPase-like protein [Candidatus Symbiobacter mobilis]|uniref:ATPase-like protein n=1 Tax=Candidatus Symbiobacter mobilis CR TaxID=946483 RepID=U5NAS2_9BURK|nr:ATPase-like protein [Candidatus Symbiobacter mobilis]AGX88390.1 ATPase-like protein [Candidatus Symbiobacter mobilis CR]
MTTLCIAGNRPHDLASLFDSFARAGMAPPQPLQRDANVTFATWLDRVCAAHPAPESEDEHPGATPSRLWEQLAVDLMLANLDTPLWGWADVRNVETLEFWAGLDTGICFVLLCQTRAQALEAMTVDGPAGQDAAAALATWHHRHQAMLRFHLRHPDRSILLWADHALSHPHALMAEVQRRWGLALDASTTSASLATPTNPVLHHLCAHIAAQHPQHEELEHEIEGNAEPLDGMDGPDVATSPLDQPAPDMGALLQGYRTLDERGRHYAQAVAQVEQRAAQLRQAQDDVQRLSRLVEEKTKQILTAEVHLSAEVRTRQAAESDRATLAQEQGQLRQQLEETRQENDLLLEQLHGIQEELERYYARQRGDQPGTARDALHQLSRALEEKSRHIHALELRLEEETRARAEAVAQYAALAEQSARALEERDRKIKLMDNHIDGAARAQAEAFALHQTLTIRQNQELEEQAHRIQELQQRLDTETRARAEAVAQYAAQAEHSKQALDERTRQVQALEKRITEITHQQQASAKQCEALTKAHAQDKAALQAQQASATQELQKLRADHAAAAQEKTRLADQLDQARHAQTDTQAKLTEIQKENDEIIRQLHLVQEELERYYLRHRSAREELDRLTAHWTRVMRPHPDWVYAERSEHAEHDSPDARVDWTFHQASVGERTFDSLRLSTVVEQGVAGLVLAHEGGPLLHWPLSAREEPQLTVLPVRGEGHAAKLRAAHLLHLSASDWDFCLAVPKLLTQALDAPDQTLPAARIHALREGLARLLQVLHSMHGLVRFDTLSLVGHSSTPQRCVLALRLRPMHFLHHRAESFEFQVQANRLATGVLDSAHLIFAQSTLGAPFEGWTSNVPNTAGEPVMALRLAPTGWDAEHFAALPKADRHFVVALVAQLTVVFVALQAQKVQASTPWKDWIDWANALRKWAQHQPAPAPEPAAAAPVPPALAPSPPTPSAPSAPPASTAPQPTASAPLSGTVAAPTPIAEDAPPAARIRRPRKVATSTTPTTKPHAATVPTAPTAMPTAPVRRPRSSTAPAAPTPVPAARAPRTKKGG